MGTAGVAAGIAGGALAARTLGGAVAGGWAAGGGQVAAARNAAGALPSGGSTPAGGSAGGGGPSAVDFGRAPVSSTVQTLRMAGQRLLGGNREGAADDPPPPPPADETVARAQGRRGGLGDTARGAAGAAMQSDAAGAGMSATPTRRDDEPDPKGEA